MKAHTAKQPRTVERERHDLKDNLADLTRIPAKEFEKHFHDWMERDDVARALQAKLRSDLIKNFNKTNLGRWYTLREGEREWWCGLWFVVVKRWNYWYLVTIDEYHCPCVLSPNLSFSAPFATHLCSYVHSQHTFVFSSFYCTSVSFFFCTRPLWKWAYRPRLLRRLTADRVCKTHTAIVWETNRY